MITLTTSLIPSRSGYSRKRQTNTRRASFEGGYSQRSTTGPNSILETVTLSWSGPEADIDAIEAQLAGAFGVEAIQYSVLGADKIWTCDEWSITCLGGGRHRLTTTLRQEFDIT